ncbi:MAG: Phosphoesterase PA-phosphatase-like protein [candidate division Zixibacteria bacterium RBG-1]|nr:MAG: Phosphoesterase PA-phosphatase-like protein [candidate division Zixibacteria bacterium RBG-1]OGC83920.1 MAG: hypothetical protein A2V73_03660 [candidate division Zixibacteria bacterium RBG_19FT_COMBO_42_43]
MRHKVFLFSILTIFLFLLGCNNKQVLGPNEEPIIPRPTVLSDDPASAWNQLTTELGLKAKLPPPRFARAYALVQVAIYDVLVTHQGESKPQRALAAGAAFVVLNYLFPHDAERISQVLSQQIELSEAKNKGLLNAAFNVGRGKGNLVVFYRKNDSSDAVFPGPMPTGDCIWTGTNPVLPMCGTWKTWIVTDGAEFQPPPPYPCGSEQDLLELDQVYQASFNRTAEQIAIVHKWADLPPPTIWNGYLIERVESNNLSILASARAFAYLNITMLDAFVCCWNTKYTYWTARPFQRLPEDFTTVITTPNFPSYTSGHSTISGAAAPVMGELFPAEKAFFQAEAEEAAISRFWGGIHYHQDDNQGLAVGKKIGEKAVAQMQSAGDSPILAGSLVP